MTKNTNPRLFAADAQGTVECLGMAFPSDDARRAYFTAKLREKLKDPEFRKVEGFPVGEDEDILAMSDPPYYTACPNPFIQDFVASFGRPFDPKRRITESHFRQMYQRGKMTFSIALTRITQKSLRRRLSNTSCTTRSPATSSSTVSADRE